jgi:integration host factor subunit beta
MNKSQLVEALAGSREMTLREAEIIVNTIFRAMCDNLTRGERIEIRGFGSFKINNYGSYTGRNPKTGENIDVKPKRLPFFKVGKELKSRVDVE